PDRIYYCPRIIQTQPNCQSAAPAAHRTCTDARVIRHVRRGRPVVRWCCDQVIAAGRNDSRGGPNGKRGRYISRARRRAVNEPVAVESDRLRTAVKYLDELVVEYPRTAARLKLA